LAARQFFAANPVVGQGDEWRRRAISGALTAGLCWGAGGAGMMLAEPGLTRLFLALVTAGMVAGAVPILSAVPQAFRVYAIPLVLPIILVAVFDARGAFDWMLAVVASLFLVAVLQSARLFHASLDSSLRLALEMRRMAEQLEEARRAAEVASEAKTRFLATMSHEIRTPMNGVLGMAQLLLMPGVTDEERTEYARTILASGETLLTLLNDVLDLSRVEAGRFELHLGVFQPAQLIAETQMLFFGQAQNKGLAMENAWHGDPDLRCSGDRVRLRQMLANLIGNAVKFTQHGSVRTEGRLIASEASMLELEFSVTDTGIGIPADKISELFTPFTQVDSSSTRQHGGSGLGLSIVRNLAELMGGTAGIESDVGQGTRAWFRIRVEALAVGEESRALVR
jgi:signal transduction histidine kinase